MVRTAAVRIAPARRPVARVDGGFMSGAPSIEEKVKMKSEDVSEIEGRHCPIQTVVGQLLMVGEPFASQ
jgi:hypothetical protein